MDNPEPQAAHAQGGHLPLAVRWQRMRAAYRYANLASHHVLGFTIKLVLFIYFALAVLFLVLRYAILPNIGLYKGDIEAAAGRVLGNRVTISQLSASWQGIHPALSLADVRLIDARGRQVLALPQVSATLSWWSLAAFEPRLHALEVHRPQLDVRRGLDGVLTVAGVRLDPNKKDDGRGADWLLRQREIVIRDGRVDWTDELRGRPTLALTEVTMALLNRFGGGHQFALRATPPRALGRPLDLRARFRHRFGARPSDVKRWKGELYADLRGADLAAWKRHVDMPFELASGRGSVRAWLSFDHARVAGFTADLALADVNARLGAALAPLQLAQVRGRLAAREEMLPGTEDGKPTFGAHGHTVSLTGFSVTTRDGRTLPPATLEQSWRPARGGRPEHGELKARQLDIGALSALAGYLPLPPQQRQMLADYAPRGRVLDLSANWEGRYPSLRSFRVRGDVAGLAVNARAERPAQPARAGQPALPARPATPGFQNLSGSIDASERSGSVTVDSQAAVLLLPAWFAEPMMPLDRLGLKARWTYDPGQQLLVEVENLQFAQGALNGSLSGRHTLPLQPGRGPGVADFTGKIDGFAIGQVGRFLPLATPEGLRGWLTGALQGGLLRDATLRLRGDLADFPFRATGLTNKVLERARGEFRAAGRLEDARLEYAPGHRHPDGTPLWPLAENINGRIEFDRARMEIRGDTLRTMGVALSNVKAVIPDLGAHDLKMLEIDGTAAGPLQEFLHYVAASPVPGWIGHFTDETHAGGNARLGLKLRMPLAHLGDTKVLGSLQLLGNDISLFPELPPLQAALGRIDFWERGVNLNGVGASFLGGPLALSGGTQKDGSIAIRLGGTLSADGMRRTAPVPALQRLGARLSGSTPYTGAVVVREGRRTVTLESNLAGLGLELPAPLNKPQANALPLRFTLAGEPTVNGVARDEIRVALGDDLAARYLREKQGRGPWLVQRGGIGVNVPAPEPDSGTMIHVNMRALNVDGWIAAGKAIAGTGGEASGGAGAGTPATGGEFAQYVVPDVIAGRVSELTVGERRLADVVLGATHLKDTWQANLNSRQVSGYVTWAESGSGQGLGKVTARLASLVIPESDEAEVKNLLESNQGVSATIPSLDIVAENFQLFDKRLGRLELQASNVQALAGREWRINRLALDSPEGQLKANGRWLTKDGKSNTSLNFMLDIDDAGKLLDRLGFPETLRRGKGKLSGDISWSGLPYAMDIPSLSGQVELNVESGQFLKQDPGAAKLLGVLSLQALPRLLKLDFHDVFSQGLAFDGISANAMIQRGVLRTDNLKMHGVAATILMDGSADIANETTNLRVVVIPEFNLGTGPLVYGLAVNPVIGLGSFLAQLFLRAPVMKALTYQMQISGPWKSPVITKLDNPPPVPLSPTARANARKD
ncbi:YhdP family protein [Telluria aromaticivorans]|uniref:TIGR02099 family protein n=1 Tax=Telluria aromaticivorans TaxID=2725995 RepID=A0A7Y2K093_9BURK|nr:YhdP family protein [Telluria aromaticivorans]NNG24277.1 TIGR02099 family protein [Telluria aromaticivorans]